MRQKAAAFFDAEPENVIFTMNCTHALNMAIKGVMEGGGHIITSCLEHNSVLRPIYAMAQTGKVSYSVADVLESDEDRTCLLYTSSNITLYSREDSALNLTTPKNLKFYVSSDGSKWTTLKTFNKPVSTFGLEDNTAMTLSLIHI